MKRLRRERGFSARRLADCLDVSEEAVKHWQTGRSKPYPRNARKLEAVLGVAAALLLADDDDPATESDEAAGKTKSPETRLTEGHSEL